jgi:Cullin family
LTDTVLANLTANVAGQESSSTYLNKVLQSWEHHKLIMRFLRKIFAYLEAKGGYVSYHSLPTLDKVDNSLFYTIVLDTRKQETSKAVTDLFRNMCKEGTYNIELLSSIVNMTKEVNAGSILENDNEEAFRELVSQSRELCLQGSIQDYVSSTNVFFSNEYQMIATYLFTSTDERLHLILKEEILEKAQKAVFGKFVETVFTTEEEKYNVLHQIMDLFGFDPESEGVKDLIVRELIMMM